MTSPAAGWYPDPSGDPSKLRYWDGSTWTDHFAPSQQAAPAAAQPAPEPPEAGEPGANDSVGAGEAPGDQAGQAAPTDRPEYTPQPEQAQTEQQWETTPEPEQPGDPAPSEAPTEQFSAQGYAQEQYPPAAAEQPTQQFAAGPVPHEQPTQPYAPVGHQPGYQPYAQPGQQQAYGSPQGYGQHGGAQQQQPYAAGAAPYGAPGGPQPPKKGGKGVLIGIIIAVLVILGAIGVAVWMLLSGDDDPEPAATPPATSTPGVEPTTEEPPTTEPPTDEPTQPTEPGGAAESGGTIALGSNTAGSVGPDGSWVAQLESSDLTPVLSDVRATDELADHNVAHRGNGIDRYNDDRQAMEIAGNWRAPALVAVLEPGAYEIEVSEWFGDGGEFEIEVSEPATVAIGDSVDISLTDDQVWSATVEIEDAGTYVFDTVSEEGDAEMQIVDADGFAEYSDDTNEGEGERRDPHLALDLEPGVYFVFLGEWWDDPLETTLTVSQG